MPTQTESTLYPDLNHVGMIVRDMDEAGRDASARFGLPGVVRRFTMHVQDALYAGTRVSYAAEFGFIELGATAFELIQPIGSDRSPYRDALDNHGETVHHLAFVVPSIDERLDKARKSGVPVAIVLDATIPICRFVYVEGLVHGALIELIEFTKMTP